MLINDKDVINNKKYQGQGSNVWKTPGESVYYRVPDPEGINLLPEHMAMLLGVNPLLMHGARWEVVSKTPSVYQLHCKVNSDNLLPLDIQMSLDRSHGDAPSKIRISIAGGEELITLSAQNYKSYNGEWIADKVQCHDHLAQLDSNQIWDVQDITGSKPINVVAPASMLVHDYRLVEKPIGSLMMVTGRDKKSVVVYHWPGHFLSLEELKRIQQKQNPGEATPDVGQTGARSPASVASIMDSAMPFAGGVLCLVGGVWMFKQRGAK